MPDDSLSRIDFSDTEYTIKQSLVRNKYEIFDSSETLILKAKQKLFKMKEEFPFTDPDGNVVFRIKADRRLDIAGKYRIIDEETGEKVGLLSKEFTLLKHVWKVKDPELDDVLATIESRSAAIEFLRTMSDLFSLLPHRYSITGQEEENLGTLQGRFSLKDTYDLELEKEDFPGKEVVVASAVTIDALEGN